MSIEILESYEYKGYTIQRLQRNFLWYAVKDNVIVDIDQYQNDLKERIDVIEKEKLANIEEHRRIAMTFKL